MTPNIENEDEAPATEPLAFLPPAVSMLSLNDPPVTDNATSKRDVWTRFSGVAYTLLSGLLFACLAFSIKQLGVDLLDALLLRFILQVPITFAFVRYKRYPLIFGTTTQKLLQLLCCTTGAGSFFIYFIAIRYVELSDVSTLSYTRVIWTLVFSIFLYREWPSLSTVVALPLTILGVVFVTQPTFLFPAVNRSTDGPFRVLGFGFALVSAIISAVNVLTYKRLVSTSKDMKPSVINLQYCTTVLISLIVNQLYRHCILHTGLTLSAIISWRYALASFACLLMVFVNIMVQKAIKRENPAIYLLLSSADIIFALILQNIFTSKRSNLFALLGSALVISSVLIIAMAKIRNERAARRQLKPTGEQLLGNDAEEKNAKC